MIKKAYKKMSPRISDDMVKLCIVVLSITNTSVFEKMIIDK